MPPTQFGERRLNISPWSREYRVSGNGSGPAQGPKNEVLKSAIGANNKISSHNVHDSITDILSGFTHATPVNPNEIRMLDEMKIHSVLKKLMTMNSESARSAAKACGVPLSTFNSYLKPKKQIDPAHLLAIAKHYDVSIDYLFGNELNPKFEKLPTKKLFSKWVKLTIEDIADAEDFDLGPLDKKEGNK